MDGKEPGGLNFQIFSCDTICPTSLEARYFSMLFWDVLGTAKQEETQDDEAAIPGLGENSLGMIPVTSPKGAFMLKEPRRRIVNTIPSHKTRRKINLVPHITSNTNYKKTTYI